MTWGVLTVRGSVERELRDELLDAGLVVSLPTYRVQYFHQRKSVIVEREHLLMPGYLLARCSEADLIEALHRRGVRHGDAARLLAGVPLPDQQVYEIEYLAEQGRFDVRLKDARIAMPALNARVCVTLLGMIGRVRRIVGKFAEVVLDGVRRAVLVEPHGMMPA